ncbi:MAG: MgtC/SapB family protein [Burkholderiales bacterium]|nr:MgtC/SapB family protein [Burkholderiales bacterium]
MLDTHEILLRLLVATLLGSVVGIERERRSAWAAGLRTHMLVCVGAALFMITSCIGFTDVLSGDHVTLDPSRVAAQVASGIGFLGAGTIILRRRMVHGLTTAASIWSVAAVGLAAGGGLYVAASSATGIMVTILAGLRPLERRLFAQAKAQTLTLEVSPWSDAVPRLRQLCQSNGVTIHALKIEARQNSDTAEIELTIAGTVTRIMALMQAANNEQRVKRVSARLHNL